MIELISNIPPSGSASDYAFGAVAFHRSFMAALSGLVADPLSDPEAAFEEFMSQLSVEQSPVCLAARRAISGLYGGCSWEEFESAFLGYVQEAKESFPVRLREYHDLIQPTNGVPFNV